MLNRSISLESQGNFNILKFWFNASNNIPSSALDERTYPCDKKFDLFYRFDEMHAYFFLNVFFQQMWRFYGKSWENASVAYRVCALPFFMT